MQGERQVAKHFSKEPLNDSLIAELIPMLKVHNDEVETRPQEVKWGQFLAMQSAGIYHFYTVRDEHILIGYCGFITMPSHHNEGVMAIQDAIFIDKQYRKGLLGYNFLKYCVSEIQSIAGVNAINLSTTCKPDLSKLYLRMGFKLTEKTYRKQLWT